MDEDLDEMNVNDNSGVKLNLNKKTGATTYKFADL